MATHEGSRITVTFEVDHLGEDNMVLVRTVGGPVPFSVVLGDWILETGEVENDEPPNDGDDYADRVQWKAHR